MPGIHSRPLSDEDPDIAPTLIPLRDRLTEMMGRPVNIQATRDFVMYLRGDVLGQPYLTLLETHTFPTWNPQVRLDYCFVPVRLANRVEACEVVTEIPETARASEHFPLQVPLDLP